MKKEYKIKVKFTFEGEITVIADDKENAKEIVKNNVSAQIDPKIDITSNSVTDYNFPLWHDKLNVILVTKK